MLYRLLGASTAILLLAACQAATTSGPPVKSSGQGLNRQVPDYYGNSAYECQLDGLAPGTQTYDDCVQIRALENLGKHP